MAAIDMTLGQPAAQAVGWMLVHFVWQGALIGLIAAAVLTVLRRSAPDVRYVVATIALSLMLTLPAVTAVQVWRGSPIGAQAAAAFDEPIPIADHPGRRPQAVMAPGIDAVPNPGDGVAGRLSPIAALDAVRLEPWLPLLVITWLCGVLTLSLRLMSGWLWVQRMKTRGTSPAGDALQRTAARLAKQLHIRRRVRLLRSTLVDVPTVIGWVKPVVLLPLGALAGLSPSQLEAVLAHELAHVRRHDYLVNLLQTLVETLLFYHPAVWWLSRQIRIERENCCDDLAVRLCGDPFTYARALADLEQLRGDSRQLVMAATGGSLVDRVRRLLGAPAHTGRAPGWLAGSAAIVLMTAVAVSAARTDALGSARVVPAPRGLAAPAGAPGGAEATSASQALLSPPADVRDTTRAAGRQALKTMRAVLRDTRAFVESARTEFARNVPPLPPLPPAPPDPPLPVPADQAAPEASQPRPAESDQVLDAAPALADHAGSSQAALAPSAGAAIGRPQSRGNFSWSNNGEKLEVKYEGEIEFTDDDRDVKRLSPGGSLRIRDGGWLGGRTVEFTSDASGAITRRFWIGIMAEKPFEPEGREWLRQVLPRFIRQTGIGASARVARILKSGGTSAVLAEIAQIEGSWAKRTYFKELISQGSFDRAALRQILAQAGREIESDFELASLLISAADRLLAGDESVRQAYFDAARSIGSDFELGRVYSTALKRGPVSPAVLSGILESSQSIASDFELASLLIEIARLQPIDRTARAPLLAALATVSSDFEHRRVLTALIQRTDLPDEITVALIESASAIESDFESASFLLQVVKRQPIEGPLVAPFFRAVESIQSAFERGRVLKAVAARADASSDTLLRVLRSARTMSSGFETSQVLLAVAAAHPLSGESRDAYIDAADKLSAVSCQLSAP